MKKTKGNSKPVATTNIAPSELPGINNDLIIPSHPTYIKENSYKPSKKKDK